MFSFTFAPFTTWVISTSAKQEHCRTFCSPPLQLLGQYTGDVKKPLLSERAWHFYAVQINIFQIFQL